ncbi:MAG: guanine deaminase [Granulosicoccus sp.]
MIKAIDARLLHCLDDPECAGPDAVVYIPQGRLLLDEGRIAACGRRTDVPIPDDAEHLDYQDKLLVPGFVDTHIHYPQVDMIASYGKQLLDWLERYTFPAEMRFADTEHAADAAAFFIDELLRNGTTTALVFGTVHPQSVDAFFSVAKNKKLRMICGKVMMDRNAPQALLDTAQSSYIQSQTLIERWHGVDRLSYAVTPRFAPTSTPEQLTIAGQLIKENAGVHLHTHMAENADECDWVASLFPGSQDYLEVYERFGLVGERSVFAHGIHLSDSAWKRLSASGAAIAHCPCSNLFIGSGLFDMRAAQKHGVPFGLGTDVGGGDSFSLLRTVNEAYKVQQLQGHSLSAAQAFYLATLGGARALCQQQHIGNFEPGKEADFLVINEQATPLMARRLSQQSDWHERLFSLLMLGDDRAIEETWILGKRWSSADSFP